GVGNIASGDRLQVSRQVDLRGDVPPRAQPEPFQQYQARSGVLVGTDVALDDRGQGHLPGRRPGELDAAGLSGEVSLRQLIVAPTDLIGAGHEVGDARHWSGERGARRVLPVSVV